MGQAADTEDVTEETLSSVWRLIQAVSRAVPVIKKGYMHLIRDFTMDLQAVYRGAEATTAKVAEREPRLSELDMNAQLLTEKASRTADLQKRSGAKSKELELVNKELEEKNSVLKEQSHDKSTMEIELKVARAAADRKKRVYPRFCRACMHQLQYLNACAGIELPRSALFCVG